MSNDERGQRTTAQVGDGSGKRSPAGWAAGAMMRRHYGVVC